MKKIHITESQLKQFAEFKKKIDEQDSYTVDATKEIEDAGGNVRSAISNIKANNPQQGSDFESGRATVTFNPEAVVKEGYITKKQIKEARLAKRKAECRKITKSDIK